MVPKVDLIGNALFFLRHILQFKNIPARMSYSYENLVPSILDEDFSSGVNLTEEVQDKLIADYEQEKLNKKNKKVESANSEDSGHCSESTGDLRLREKGDMVVVGGGSGTSSRATPESTEKAGEYISLHLH